MIKPVKFEIQRHISITIIVFFACLLICSCATRLFAVDVKISKFESVSTKVSTNITVTVSPSSVTDEEVYLNLRLIEGTGGALFLPGKHTSTNISQTSTLQIIGQQLSSVEGNMILEAKVKEMVVASNVFTVVDTDISTESRAIKTTTVAKKGRAKTQEKMITKNKAIEIATAATKGKVAIQEGAPITVELKGRDYIVTFGYIRPDPKEQPGWRGPDFSAKVVLDAFTGSVKNGIQRSE